MAAACARDRLMDECVEWSEMNRECELMRGDVSFAMILEPMDLCWQTVYLATVDGTLDDEADCYSCMVDREELYGCDTGRWDSGSTGWSYADSWDTASGMCAEQCSISGEGVE